MQNKTEKNHTDKFPRKIQITKKKTIATLIALFLMSAMVISFLALPTTNAHSPPWNYQSFAYIVPAPNPVGVGQRVLIVFWIDYPLPSAVVGNDIRRHDYTLTITKPDGTVETKNWPIVYDTTSIQYTSYTPTQVGTYTLKFDYPGQTYTWSGAYQNDTFSAATKTVTLTVQQEQLPAAINSYPLPTEYWTRPIEGQNTYWFSVSSNWLRGAYIANRVQPSGSAPNSAHVMWSKPLQDGGLVGGTGIGIDGNTYYMGGSYNVRWSAPIIMYGRLFYELPYGNSGGGGGYVAVDLRTGEQLWYANTTGIGVPSFGYLYALDTPNQHGVLPDGALFTSNFARAYDPSTGIVTTMNLTRVPSGTEAVGSQGEILRYSITNVGTSANPSWMITQWNSSNVFGGASGVGVGGWYSGNIPANAPITPARVGTNTYWNGTMWVSNAERSAQGYTSVTTPAYDWNVSTTLGPGSWSITRVDLDNMMFLTQGNFGGRPGTYYGGDQYGANVTVISLKPGSIGQVLWTKSYAAAANNVTRVFADWDPHLGIWITEDKETLVHNGWSLTDGSQVWGPTKPTNDYTYFRSTTITANGKFYFAGYGGTLYAYDVKNGSLLWTYGNGGPGATGNSTFSGLETSWGTYPIFITAIADGKIFTSTTEHSPGSPFYKDSRVRAVDADTGKEVWTLMGWGTGMDATYDIVADGFYTFLNCYDMKVYSIGKGPSATTVSASPKVTVNGGSILVEGTVMDTAAGTKQAEQAARFPYGVPAVSDASQSAWMEYVYMQKPRPTDVTGVDVKITVIDPNGNGHEFTATSDSMGQYSYLWSPPVPGKYKVIAQFAGSESYWPSIAETSFGVDQAASAAPTLTPTATPTFAPTIAPNVTALPTSIPNPTGGLAVETYVAIASVIMISVVAAAALVLRSRKLSQ